MQNKSILARNFLTSVFIVVLVLGFALAAHVITTSEGTTSKNILEDVSSIINITIENPDAGDVANITAVNITLDGNFTFIPGSNGTSTIASFFNYSSSFALNWYNESGMVYNSLNQSFWFNATIATPGAYNITVSTINDSGSASFSQRITIVVNDTTYPSLVEFNVSQVPASGSNLSQTFIPVNISVADNGIIDTITIMVYNSTDLRNISYSVVSSLLTNSFFMNYTDLPDETYYINATVNDSYGLTNLSVTRVIILDNVIPVPAFSTGAAADGTNATATAIYVNVTVTETNEANITFSLSNTTGIWNSTTFKSTSGTKTRAINWTSLPDAVYTYNVTVSDIATHVNYTTTRTITIDSTLPVIGFGNRSEVSGTNVSRASIYVNVTVTETNEFNITFNLYNTTGIVNSTTNITAQRVINWTGLPNGAYYYNITVTDTAGNVNNSATRKITLDTVNPVPTFSCTPQTTSQGSTISCSCTSTDALSTPVLVYTANPSTSTIGSSFNTTCTATDGAGNSANASFEYAIIQVLAGGSSSSGSSGGGSSSPGVTTTVVTTDQFANGYEKEISSNERMEVVIQNSNHYVSLVSASNGTATITVTSTPQTATLSIGETKKFNVNGDNSYDISVTLVRTLNGKATLSIIAINESIPSTSAEEQTSDTTSTVPEEVQPTEEVSESSGISSTVITIIVIVVVIIILFLVFRPKKRK